ncbi:ficolin-2-like isoform X1 [Stylophora pistillata]|nr:ficolin-2-like isoform X1 [Stylophora pistillata]
MTVMIRQGIGFATLFVALSVTFQITPSMHAAPIACTRLTAKNCAELYTCGQTISGVYTIDPDGSGAFNVYCDQTTAGGGWTVFQKRLDGSVDFNRTWSDYKRGFGNFIGELWLGLDKINRLTANKTKNMLRVDLGVETGETVHAEYSWFGIGNEADDYRLHVGIVTNRNFLDSLGPHRGSAFGTWDSGPAYCGQERGGGWWYRSCSVSSNLNGIYSRCGNVTIGNIFWSSLGPRPRSAAITAPTSTEMKIRPVGF